MTEPLKLGVAGLGTVGAGLLGLVEKHSELIARRAGRKVEIVAVSARERSKDRGVALDGMVWHDDPVALAQSNTIDVFVELIGGEEGPARASVEAALDAGRHVVTANKALLAIHGAGLARRAEKTGAALNYEAAVTAGIPIVKTLREALAGNRVRRLFGIMNGTCNYILTTMENEARDFADVLQEAQRLGYAEADPSFDIGGYDTAHKLAILTSLAFGTEVSFEDVYVEGIDSITIQDIRAAGDLGYRIKLLGISQDTGHGIEQRVHPTLVPKTSAIAEVDGVFNAVAVEGDFVGNLMLEGLGAGAGPTASAVIGDIVDIAHGANRPAFGVGADMLKPYERAQMRAHEGGYYMRLMAFDRPGAVAAIAQRMADQEISLESIVQRGSPDMPRGDGNANGGGSPPVMPVALVTHETREAAIRAALEAIEADGHIASPPNMMRIERV